MHSGIRAMEAGDREAVLKMMRAFYASPAVLTGGSEDIFAADFHACISDDPFLEGYIFQDGETVQGYAMLAKSFSTEFGKPCVWIEDLYLREAYRGLGLGSRFLRFIREKYPDCVFRLEVEAENTRAMHVYRTCGFDTIPYTEMIRKG